MRVCLGLLGLFFAAVNNGVSAQSSFTAPKIEGFNPSAPSIVAPAARERPAAKPHTKTPSKKATRSQARRNQPVPSGLYRNNVEMNPLPGQITAPMPNPRDFTVPPPVPPASPLASPPPGQSCDPFGPGHCGMRWR